MKKDDENKDSGPPTIEIDASVTPTEQTPGKGANYGSGSNQITVTKDTNTTAPTKVPDNYVRYKHYSTSTFTIGLVKHNDFPLDLSPTVTDPVTAVYVYYEKDNDTAHEFPLIVCVKVSTTDIKYYQRGNTWTPIGNLTGKNPETLEDADLTTLKSELEGLKVKYEVKLEKTDSSPGNYTATPQGTTITVGPINDTRESPACKGFKHYVTGVTTFRINRITIHGHVTNGIDQNEIDTFSFETNGGVFVYFPLDSSRNPELHKPLLICLSKTGQQSSNSGDNRWYKRTGSAGQYTWANADGDYPNKNPNNITDFATQLGTINGNLAGDLGYPKPSSIQLPEITGQTSANNVEIKIDEKSSTYTDSNSNGITVLTFSDNPKGGFTRYSHYLTSKKKMKSGTKFKNSSGNYLQSGGVNITAQNVHYVHVYYGGTDNDKPLLIAVCINSGASDTWTYYRNNDPTSADSTLWPEETTLNQEPTSTYHDFLMHLDKLNDQANQQTVLNLEKTDTEGTSGSSYTTGSGGTTQITVDKKTNTDPNVPQGYVRYKHTPGSPISDTITYKHNGFELTFDQPPTGTVEAVYVYYRGGGQDNEHQFPLIVCVKTNVATDIRYYKRGNSWTRITDAQLNNKNPETLTGEDLKKLGDELNDVKGKFEVKLEKIKGTYIARPDTSSHEITVEPLCPDSTYTFKGFKHEVPSGSVINRVTIHGQAITEINDTALANKRYVFVYFEKADADEARKKPLLICLSENVMLIKIINGINVTLVIIGQMQIVTEIIIL